MNLEKLSQKYQELQYLDKVEQRVKQIAERTANNEGVCSLAFEFTPYKDEDGNILDEDGSLRIGNKKSSPYGMGIFSFMSSSSDDDEDDNDENKISGHMSQKMSLLFFNILLQEIKQSKEGILKSIKKLSTYE